MDDNTKKASVAFVDLAAANVPGGSDTTYAVALDKTYTNKVDGTTYYFTKFCTSPKIPPSSRRATYSSTPQTVRTPYLLIRLL